MEDIIIPSKGDSIKITTDNIWYYYHILKVYENATINIYPDYIKINDSVNPEFKFNNDYYFLIGDNSEKSIDSRQWGLIPEKNFKWIYII
jgi:signal peptidase I